MKFCFFASNVVPIDAFTILERPIGGVETGVIRLSEALVRLGHEVTVYTPHESPRSDRVRYRPFQEIESQEPVDCFVSIRDWIPLFYKVEARRRYLWTGDSYDQFANFGIGDKRAAESMDALLTVSAWHADTLSKASGFERDRCVVLENGVEVSLFEGQETRDPMRMIYSSTPHRGLMFAPALITQLRKKYPDLTLHVFSSYKVYEQTGTRDFEHLKQQLLKTPGIVVHESVKQSELAREMMKSSILFYPTHFEETFCITALEAQAAGCVPVTSRLAALETTVGDGGVLIDGQAGTHAYTQACLAAIEDLLSHPEKMKRLSDLGRARAAERSWTKVAERFSGFVDRALTLE